MTHRSVVMVSPNFHPYLGGAEKQALELSKSLVSSGIWVRVLTRRKEGMTRWERVSGVEILRLAAWGKGTMDSLVFMASSFVWLLRHRDEYHAVHVHLAGSPAISAALAARLTGRPVVVKIGGGRGIGELAASSRTWAGRLKLRFLAALRPQFSAVTQDLVGEMTQYGLGKAPVVVVPNGVDTARYHPVSAAEKAALRKGLGWPERLCFLYVGRFSAEKRLDFFFGVFADALREAGVDAFFALIGTGPEEQRLKRAAEAAGLEGKVRFHSPTSDVAGAYSSADVFVLPSVSEGLSNSLLEAMASGCAILASKVGGTVEAVRDGEGGYLFNPMDAKGLKTSLLKFLRNPGRAEELGRKARETAAERFDVSIVAKRYKELYRFGDSSGT